MILEYLGPKLFTNQMSIVASELANVSGDKHCTVLFANCDLKTAQICLREDISEATAHRATHTGWHINQEEMLVFILDEPRIVRSANELSTERSSTTSTCTWLTNFKAICPETKSQTRLNTSGLMYLPTRKRPSAICFRSMGNLSGQLREINVTELQIDLKADVKRINSPPFRAGQKNRDLDEYKIRRQFTACVVEPATSEWTSPVLFVPKKYGLLRTYIYYINLNFITVKDRNPLCWYAWLHRITLWRTIPHYSLGILQVLAYEHPQAKKTQNGIRIPWMSLSEV